MHEETSSTSSTHPESTLLGRGRSATVFKIQGVAQPVARKVFTGSGVADLVNSMTYGAPNDYRWCRAAIRSAFYRRRVLARLVEFWFEDHLSVSHALDWSFDESHQAYALDTAFVNGQPAPLYSPFHTTQKKAYHELRHVLMPTLQAKLIEAGFVGTAWQAGKGQPCAIANFLCIEQEGAPRRWVWVDLESGVPAIACYRPLSLFGFYLPQAVRHGRFLFDDLDGSTLRAYIDKHALSLNSAWAPEEWETFNQDVKELIASQAAWATECRQSRSLGYYSVTGRITEDEKTFYSSHRGAWMARVTRFVVMDLGSKLSTKLGGLWRRYHHYFNPLRWIRAGYRVIVSRAYRVDLSRKFVRHGLRTWESWGRLNTEQVRQLEEELEGKGVSPYLADFGAHLSLKPLGYLLRLTLIPFAWSQGWISGEVAGLLFVFCGVVLRSMYTLVRVVEEFLCGRPLPWVAMALTPIPTLGTLSYACQMLHTARQGHRISQFMIYATCSAAAEKLPIWGGRDSEWDHVFNTLGYGLIHLAGGKE